MRLVRMTSILVLCLAALTAAAQMKVPVAGDAEHSPVQKRPDIMSADEMDKIAKALPAAADYSDTLYQFLKIAYPKLDGKAYVFSTDNSLAGDLFDQTPNVWGKAAKDVPLGAGDYMATNVQLLVSSATQAVDITSLTPFPTGKFATALKNALVFLAQNNRTVTVRILVGWYPDAGGKDQSQYLRDLIAPLKSIKSGNLTIYVGTQRSNDEYSWNHSKMVAVDGQRVILGGENLWDDDYLNIAPVHDLNIPLRGSFVYGMHTFADQLWDYACGYILPNWKPVMWKTGMSDIQHGCVRKIPVTKGPGPRDLHVLGAGRLAYVFSDANPADAAMAFALQSSTTTLRIAQQDLGNHGMYWDPAMNAIAKALVAKQNVYIVLTNDKAQAGPNGASYTTGTSIASTAGAIKTYVQRQKNAPVGNALTDLLCSNLHFAPLRFGPSDAWPNGYTFANHAKFFMVDDKVFYIGSENLYPSNLQEYGVFIGNKTVVSMLRAQYWDKLWKYSSRVAVSGTEATQCIYRQ